MSRHGTFDEEPPRGRVTTADHGADVLTRARAGDERAFLALYRAAQPGLLRYLAVLVGTDAEDVAAKTWTEVSQRLASFPGELDQFRRWVAGVARELADQHLAELQADGREASRIDPLTGPTPPRAARALGQIADLPRQQAEAITLRAVLGMPEQEAADVLGLGRTALRRTAERGLRALGRRLDSHGTPRGRSMSSPPPRPPITHAGGPRVSGTSVTRLDLGRDGGIAEAEVTR